MTSAPIPRPIRIGQNLHLIPLDLPIAGFYNFICAYVHTGAPAFIVDVGPAASAPRLRAALASLNVRHLDYILLTHIHLDHAGAIAEICDTFPDAPVVCHPDAHTHLQDPSRLQAGTLKTLGDIGAAYGPIGAVPRTRLRDASGFSEKGIHAVLTPGHAPHHVAYRFKDMLFAGEAGGVRLPTNNDTLYLRPATPPRFFLETALSAVDALMHTAPGILCYGHFGAYGPALRLLQSHREQLLLWQDIISATARDTSRNDLIPALVETLLETDPRMAGFGSLPPDVARREKFFLGNSVTGYVSAL